MSRLLRITWRLQSTGFSRHTRRYSSLPLVYSEEVRQAKAEGAPIVALESTIITHGMPYPKNLETAREVEDIVRKQGATPATIAILKGVLTVGLTKEQLEYLAQAKGVIKASRRDLAPVIAGQQDGATTVAGTIIAAELADIPVFVTGGIGGVHREGEDTMDISADLTELGRSKTLVVCSGVKSILDIGRTLEFLETQGVTVCSFGESNDFPAFYTTSSGYYAPNRATDALHAARILYTARQLHLSSGIVIAVPVPEKNAMDNTIIEAAIKNALVEVSQQGITGKEVTPFLLAAVSAATGGASLDANIALIKNNAKVGADIAVQFQKLRNVDNLENAFNIGVSKSPGKCTTNSSRRFHTSCAMGIKQEENMINNDLGGDVLVIGGANVDRTYRVTEESVQLDGSTHACMTEQCGGGVGRNIAEALWRLRGGRTRLLTAIGDDADGQYLQNIARGLIFDDCVVKSARTAKYAAVFDAKGECRLGLGDMDIHNQITVELVNRHINVLKSAPLVVLDGNIPLTTMDYVLGICAQFQKPVFYEPTDRRKAIKPFHGKHSLTYASPNLMELRTMANFMEPDINVIKTNELDEIIELSKVILKCVRVLIVTRGSKGAGDCFASGFIHGILQDLQESQSISIGFETAKQALLSKETVPLMLRLT
ncbi:uncharacterized protein [Maniola hyperantus]|uniref:uncharacterized protein isoform X2 n=1 Tax=Aphantopus hyperantus TaxID=2795564 RepID=UPI001568E425|nr:pseudouridine-metabolizing bifunctional protein C1861.05 [Maniola hyperantus]